MTIVEIGNKLYPVPQKWEELSFQQLADVLPVLYSDKELDQGRLQILKVITGITWFRLKVAGAADYQDKLYLVDWMLQENTLTKNLLPLYRNRWGYGPNYYGPADDFNNLLISEFIFTEQYYHQYRYEDATPSANVDALNKLVAVLYRPGKKGYDRHRNPDGDIREPFNDNLIPYQSRLVAAWPFEFKQAIGFWYEGCRNQLLKDFPKVFGGSGGGESVYGLWDILFNIAEKNVMGDMHMVEGQLLKTVLMVITKTIHDAEQLEKMYKKGK